MRKNNKQKRKNTKDIFDIDLSDIPTIEQERLAFLELDFSPPDLPTAEQERAALAELDFDIPAGDFELDLKDLDGLFKDV